MTTFRQLALTLTLASVAVACDQAVPSAPTSDGGRRPRIEQVQAAEGSATITVNGNDEVGPQSVSLAEYPDNLIADVTIEGAIHFDGDTTDTPDHLPSGDIGPAGFLVGATRCILRATVTFRIGGLGAQGDCPAAPTGPQTLTQTELIAGTPLFQMESANSTRNFCGPTVICVTWSGSFKLTIHPEQADLALNIDHPSPDSGQTVTVTASATPSSIAGIAVPISDVVWQVPGASCGGGLVCSFTATQSGDIEAAAVVNGSTSTADVSVQVRAPIDTTHHDSIPGDSTLPCLAKGPLTSGPASKGLKTSGQALMRASCGGGPKAKVRLTYGSGTPVLQGDIPIILPAGIRRSASQYDTTAGRPPFFGAAIWPDSLVVIAHVDSAGQELVGRSVQLIAEAVDSEGRSIDSLFGHAHHGAFGSKPAGHLRQTTVRSGVVGADSTTFLPSQVSGPIILRGELPDADSFVDTIWVGVPGLVQVQPTASYDTTGGVPPHPHGHNVWVTPEMLDTLARFADSVFRQMNIRPVFNDASLPYGGKFDLDLQWDQADIACQFKRGDGTQVSNPGGCHQTHRTGWDVDLRTKMTFTTPAMIRAVREYWRTISCTLSYFEGDHIHLARRDGGPLYQGDHLNCQ